MLIFNRRGIGTPTIAEYINEHEMKMKELKLKKNKMMLSPRNATRKKA